MCRHGIGQGRGNNALARHGGLGHGALLDAACTDVIQQQHAHLVARKQLVAAVFAAHGNAHTVGIRVGGQHQIGILLFGQLQAKAQGLKNFGVGIRAGGEIAVRVLLLGHDGDIRNANVVQHTGDRHQSRAVQRAVHQLQAGCFAQAGAHAAGFDGGVQRFLTVIAHILDQALFHSLGKGQGFCALQNIGFLNFGIHGIGCIVGHLAAIGAIGLIAVVLGGVVAGRDHNTGVALIIARGKAQRGHRHQLRINAHLHAVGRQHLGCRPGKHIAFNAAVIADGHRLAAALRFHPVGQALCGLTHGINIHTVGACADHTAQTRGAEFQRHGKSLANFVFIVPNTFQLGLQVGVIQLGIQPALIHFMHHNNSTCSFGQRRGAWAAAGRLLL